MAETKHLVLVIEGTAALGLHWPTIVSDYLEKIIRSFCGNEHTRKPGSPIAEVSFVIFNDHRPSSQWLVRRSAWTNDVEMFMTWLRGIDFGGDGFRDVAIAEGLGEALMMFPYLHVVRSEQYRVVLPKSQRHCILVAASNPHPLPTPVYTPPPLLNESESHSQSKSKSQLYNALTVSQTFLECLVSLSVISPTNLPIHRAIYNAAKRINPTAIDPTIDSVKNPEFLLLISQDFMDAHAALRQREITNLPSKPSTKKTMIDLSLEDYDNMPKAMTSSGQAESATLHHGTSTTTTMATQVVANDQVATNIAGPSETAKPLWEGNLSDDGHVFITRLQAYRHTESSESLADNWPFTMQINNVVPQDYMENEKFLPGKIDYLSFRAMDQHQFLVDLQEKQIYAVISLPSHILYLNASNTPGFLYGTLIPKEMVIYHR